MSAAPTTKSGKPMKEGNTVMTRTKPSEAMPNPTSTRMMRHMTPVSVSVPFVTVRLLVNTI
jgi:hypothetical protein